MKNRLHNRVKKKQYNQAWVSIYKLLIKAVILSQIAEGKKANELY